MNQSEYMKRLREALSDYEEEIRNEIIEDYEEHYQIGLEKGKTEEQISEELGSIEEFVKEMEHSEIGKRPREFKNKEMQPVEKIEYIATPAEGGNIDESSPQEQLNIIERSEDTGSQGDKKQGGKQKSQSSMPSRIIIRSKFASVDVKESQGNRLKVDYYNYGNEQMQRCIQFRTWTEGNTFYGEIIKTGFRIGMFYNQEPKISIELPKGFPQVEIHSLSGNTRVEHVDVDAFTITSASGDISIYRLKAGQCRFETKSGAINIQLSEVSRMYADTASGGLRMEDSRIDVMNGRTMSGSLYLRHMTGREYVANAISGDLEVDGVKAVNMRMSSISGDCDIIKSSANEVSFTSKSGDVNADIECSRCSMESVSGDIALHNMKECEVNAKSVSGDVDLRINQCSGYQATVRTVSGDVDMRFMQERISGVKTGNFNFGSGSSKVNVGTVSGDIVIYAQY